jgi:hypothetical protein
MATPNFKYKNCIITVRLDNHAGLCVYDYGFHVVVSPHEPPLLLCRRSSSIFFCGTGQLLLLVWLNRYPSQYDK